MRQGFTLVETLVALLLFQIGMLAVAATGAMAARDIAIARRAAHASDLARNRVEELRASACREQVPGVRQESATSNGAEEHWRVSAAGTRRDIADSVAFPLPAGRTGSVVIRTAALCEP